MVAARNIGLKYARQTARCSVQTTLGILGIIGAMPNNARHDDLGQRKGRLSLDNFPLSLASASSKAFPDGPKGRKRAIITLLALLLDPELPEDVKRFLSTWGYQVEQYPDSMDPRGLYSQLLDVISKSATDK